MRSTFQRVTIFTNVCPLVLSICVYGAERPHSVRECNCPPISTAGSWMPTPVPLESLASTILSCSVLTKKKNALAIHRLRGEL